MKEKKTETKQNKIEPQSRSKKAGVCPIACT